MHINRDWKVVIVAKRRAWIGKPAGVWPLGTNWRRFFYYVFHIQWQKYLFENVNFFCHFYRANSIKTNLLTCNLWTKWSVSYKSVNLFWLNYFWHWMWKTFCYSDRANSNLKIDIFDIGCEKHSRRNAFSTEQSGKNDKKNFTFNVKNNSIKTNLRTWNLKTFWSISYK